MKPKSMEEEAVVYLANYLCELATGDEACLPDLTEESRQGFMFRARKIIKELSKFATQKIMLPPKKVCTMYEGKKLSQKEKEMMIYNNALDDVAKMNKGRVVDIKEILDACGELFSACQNLLPFKGSIKLYDTSENATKLYDAMVKYETVAEKALKGE